MFLFLISKKAKISLFLVSLLFISYSSCKKEGNIEEEELIEYSLFVESNTDIITNGMSFTRTNSAPFSKSQSFTLKGENLTSEVILTTSDNFQVSNDNETFSNQVILAADFINTSTKIYVRFNPIIEVTTNVSGTIIIDNNETDEISINIIGKAAISDTFTIQTFNKERTAFGGGYSQQVRKFFTLNDDNTNIESIMMYVQLTCPEVGCDEWDVFANVKIFDPITGEQFELGRFITPYWNDNSQLPRGFVFDVTDFKSILKGDIELRIRTECWNARGYEVTVEFDYTEGVPDYKYYEIARVLNYDSGSAGGVPYGISHNIDVTRTITIPENVESTHLRTFINGWGEATPADSGGRRCAEWCYRTHHIKINDLNTFEHYMGPLGCANNTVSNQDPGNWKPDRAGWCPGMEIPLRINKFETSKAGETFQFEYTFQEWTNDGAKDSYYPISTFIVVKSNTEIDRPIVID